MRCKFVCQWKQTNESGTTAQFGAVTSGSPENQQFFKWTPGGTLNLYVVGDAAAEQIEMGREYYLDITPAERPV